MHPSSLRSAVVLPLLFAFGITLPAQQSGISVQEHARRANEYLKARQPEKAIPEFAAIAEVEPNNVDVVANLGVLLYFQSDFAKAEPYLHKAVQLDTTLARIQGLLGLCEYQEGKLDAARSDLAAAWPNLTEPRFRKETGLTLVEIETAQKDLDAAAVTIQKMREAAPTDAEILYASYRIHTDLAGESLLNLSLAAPDSGQMQQAIAHELSRIGDHAGAVASYHKAIAADPKLPGIHFELAEALRAANGQAEREQAEKEYALALAENPHELQAAVRLGDFQADRGKLDAAAEYYKRALLQPGNVEAALGMARVFNERGENDAELEMLQRALEYDPANLQAHFRLVALYRKLHRLEDAKRELAEYQKFKRIKDGLHQVYSTMHIQAPHNADDNSVHGSKGDVVAPK